MATRSQRRGAAKNRRRELEAAVKLANMLDNGTIVRHPLTGEYVSGIALREVGKWHRKGSRVMCHPGLDKVV